MADKADKYELLLAQMEALLVANGVSNMANAAALLFSFYHSQPRPQREVNWAGFYTIRGRMLELGPFQGNVACQIIEFGKGVCGTAVAENRTVLVRDVHEFPGHIACDAASSSEIVVPICEHQRVVGVIDIDCRDVGGFDRVDQRYLERLATLLAPTIAQLQPVDNDDDELVVGSPHLLD